MKILLFVFIFGTLNSATAATHLYFCSGSEEKLGAVEFNFFSMTANAGVIQIRRLEKPSDRFPFKPGSVIDVVSSQKIRIDYRDVSKTCQAKIGPVVDLTGQPNALYLNFQFSLSCETWGNFILTNAICEDASDS